MYLWMFILAIGSFYTPSEKRRAVEKVEILAGGSEVYRSVFCM